MLEMSRKRKASTLEQTQLFNLSNDILRSCLFPYLDLCSLGICRTVCNKFRNLIEKQRRSFIPYAIDYGYLKILKWANQNKYKLDFSMPPVVNGYMYDFIYYDRYDTPCMKICGVEFIRPRNWVAIHNYKNVFVRAAYCGHLAIIQHYWTSSMIDHVGYIIDYACIGGNLSIVLWIIDNSGITIGKTLLERIYYYAINYSHLNILKWVFNMGLKVKYLLNIWILVKTALNESFEVFQWLLQEMKVRIPVGLDTEIKKMPQSSIRDKMIYTICSASNSSRASGSSSNV